ncbi:MAG: molybdate ABC transporter substrate-binding protein [Proteobacteria bacterium]|nr:molybdate ABC transporter substrate-binding protein [Pseudomonadota bacterium]MBU1596179.1 molybdate ABC transporter substrate-binding protein [Pseudomonadota bacterium]
MKRLALAVLLLFALVAVAQAEPLTVASGAGYKKLVTELAAAFESKTGKKTELIFGNMGQIVAQAKASGKVHMVIGEQSFFKQAGLDLASFTELGRGVLVLAWPKGAQLTSLADLAKPGVQRVAMPDPARAIYGVAGKEALSRAGLTEKVSGKLLVVATVPQVTTYVVTGEVDAGLTNLTDVMGLGEKIGGYLNVDQGLYAPISIGAGVVSGSRNQDAAAFVAFLGSPQGRELAKMHGL